ncbi:hypothetical protein ACP70R_018413 [Stipagrostis hirtigluma subsp. patula]
MATAVAQNDSSAEDAPPTSYYVGRPASSHSAPTAVAQKDSSAEDALSSYFVSPVRTHSAPTGLGVCMTGSGQRQYAS